MRPSRSPVLAIPLFATLLAAPLTAGGCATEFEAYEAAREVDSIPAWAGFLDDHPDGEYASEAARLLDDLRDLDETRTVGTAEAWIRLIRNDPRNHRRADAEGALTDVLLARLGKDPSAASELRRQSREAELGFVRAASANALARRPAPAPPLRLHDLPFEPWNLEDAPEGRRIYTTERPFLVEGADGLLAIERVSHERFEPGEIGQLPDGTREVAILIDDPEAGAWLIGPIPATATYAIANIFKRDNLRMTTEWIDAFAWPVDRDALRPLANGLVAVGGIGPRRAVRAEGLVDDEGHHFEVEFPGTGARLRITLRARTRS